MSGDHPSDRINETVIGPLDMISTQADCEPRDKIVEVPQRPQLTTELAPETHVTHPRDGTTTSSSLPIYSSDDSWSSCIIESLSSCSFKSWDSCGNEGELEQLLELELEQF